MRANLLTILCAATLFTAYGTAQALDAGKVALNTPAQGGTALFEVLIGAEATTSGTVTVTDTGGTGLSNITFISAPAGWTCVGATCTTSTPFVGLITPYFGLVTATVSTTAPLSITNTVTASGGGLTTGTFTTPTITVTPEPFLTITKTQTNPVFKGNPLPVATGQSLTYKLDVDNIGAAPTTGTVTVVDTLASDMVIGKVTTGGGFWSCSNTVNVVTCTTTNAIPGATMNPGEAPNINVTAAVLGTDGSDTAVVTYTGLNGTQSSTATVTSEVQGTTSVTFISNQTQVDVDGEVYPSGITIQENTLLNHSIYAYPNCKITSVTGFTVLETRPATTLPPWTEVTGQITASPVVVTCL
jgi:hypothetical protein